MWTCPDCSREFKKRRQIHFCGEPPESVDAYIAQQPEAVRPCLQALRREILAAAPDMEESIAWHMPNYRKGQNIIQFAAYKDYVSLYAGPEALAVFREQLTALELAGGAMRLSYDKPLPGQLIRSITHWCRRTYALK